MEAPRWEEIVEIVRARKGANDLLLDTMNEVRERYNGDFVVPWFDDVDRPEMPPVTPALVTEVVDWHAQRAGSYVPMIYCPAKSADTLGNGPGSRWYGEVRRRILAATWHQSKFELKMRRSFRHLAGYGQAVIVVRKDFTNDSVCMDVKDPLSTYPDLQAAESYAAHENCAFISGRSLASLRAQYPWANLPQFDMSERDSGIWDVLEWVDRDHWVFGVLGPRRPEQYPEEYQRYNTEFYRYRHGMGVCPVVTPSRVTLDRIASKLSHVTQTTDLMAKMQTLQVIAAEKAIFPDKYGIVADGMHPEVLTETGQFEDGRTGIVNWVRGVESLGEMHSQPNPVGQQTIDRLERNIRVTNQLGAIRGGESAGALRTGRGIDSMLAASVDPVIEEMQQTFQSYLVDVHKFVFECYKSYWPDKKMTMFTGWVGNADRVEFVPEKHIEITDNVVSYPIAGATVGEVNIYLGQLVQSRQMSQRTARTYHPWIHDPDGEEEAIRMEAMEQSLMESILIRVQEGQFPLELLLMMQKRIVKGMTVTDSLTEATKEFEELQAAQAEEQQMAQQEQMMMQQQMGGQPEFSDLAAQGGGQGPPITQGANEDQVRMQQLVSALNSARSQTSAA